MPMTNPPHLGGFVRRQIIDPHGLSVSETAKVPGVNRQALSKSLNERTTLGAEMALRLESVRRENGSLHAQPRKRAKKLRITPYVSAETD